MKMKRVPGSSYKQSIDVVKMNRGEARVKIVDGDGVDPGRPWDPKGKGGWEMIQFPSTFEETNPLPPDAVCPVLCLEPCQCRVS